MNQLVECHVRVLFHVAQVSVGNVDGHPIPISAPVDMNGGLASTTFPVVLFQF